MALEREVNGFRIYRCQERNIQTVAQVKPRGRRAGNKTARKLPQKKI
jgi:hypothetical protein